MCGALFSHGVCVCLHFHLVHVVCQSESPKGKHIDAILFRDAFSQSKIKVCEFLVQIAGAYMFFFFVSRENERRQTKSTLYYISLLYVYIILTRRRNSKCLPPPPPPGFFLYIRDSAGANNTYENKVIKTVQSSNAQLLLVWPSVALAVLSRCR